MKIISVMFILYFLVLCGCSGSGSSGGGEEVLARFVREQPVTGSGSIFHYEYSIGGSETEELRVYVKDLGEYVEITAGSNAPSLRNNFKYYPGKTAPNFFYELRDLEESAYSLREAVDKAVLYYLENF